MNPCVIRSSPAPVFILLQRGCSFWLPAGCTMIGKSDLEIEMGLVDQKVVVVTGGAQGIGLCAVERFAEEGAVVAIWDFNEEKGNSAVSALKEKGFNIRFQQVNVTDMASVK